MARPGCLLVGCALSLAACGGTATPPTTDLGRDDLPSASTDVADGALPSDATTDAAPACTSGIWDPASDTLDEWPDPRVAVTDPTTATGFRLDFTMARFASTLAQTAGFSPVFTALSQLDGFGVNAQAFFRYTGPFDPTLLPSAEQSAMAAGGMGFVVLSPGTPRIEGALVTTADDGATLLLAPLHPLPASSVSAAFVTRRLAAAAGGCLQPSGAQSRVLADPVGTTAQAVTALQSLGAISTAQDLVSLTVFPVQTTVTDSVAVAADIAGRSFTVATRRPCTVDTQNRWRQCELTFEAANYLDAHDHLAVAMDGGVAPASHYVLPVTVWLPPAGVGSAPYRTIVFGHGLASGREQAAQLADFAGPAGFATIAIDAVDHGGHPLNTAPDAGRVTTTLNFFALQISPALSLDAVALRDHFRQSSYDKLQLVRLIQGGLDADGDGTVDLDGSHLAYLGVSLGGIMGPEPLSLTDAFSAAVLVVPGGRVSAIVSDSPTFGPLVNSLRPRGVTPGDVTRFFPVLQTVIDRGDAASYGPHVLHDRLTPGGSAVTPSALLGMVLDDNTVPNVCNFTFARAMGVGIVPPLLRAAPGLTLTAPPGLSGNLAGGHATAGMLQFDVIREGNGTVTPATHDNIGASAVGAEAWLHFLTTQFNHGLAEIEDPYAATHLPHAM